MRKRKPKPRIIAPDPRYQDTTVTRFVNNMMWEGKKSTAFTIFYDALDIVKTRALSKELELIQGRIESATINNKELKFKQIASILDRGSELLKNSKQGVSKEEDQSAPKVKGKEGMKRRYRFK